MATLTELLGAQQTQQPNIIQTLGQSAQTAMSLATMKDEVEQKRLQTQQMQDQLDTSKYNKALGSLSTIARTRPDIAKKMIPRIQENLMKAGIPIDPNILEVMASDDDYKRRLLAASSVLSGQATDPDARAAGLAALNDFGAFDKGLDALSGQYKLEHQERIADKKMEASANAASSRAGATQGRHEERMNERDRKAMSDAKKDFDKSVKDDVEVLSQARKGEALLSSGGTISGEAAKSTIARMFEKGVLTDADIARLAGGRSLVQRGEQLLQRAFDGKLTDENRGELLKIVQTIRPVIESKIQKRAQRDAKSQAKINNRGEKEFLDIYDVPGLMALDDQPAAAPPPAAAADKAAQLRALTKPDGTPRYSEEQIQALLAKVK